MKIHKVFFFNQLVTAEDAGQFVRLHEPLLCSIYTPVRRIITIPRGFRTDGASIPRVLWSVVGSPWSGEWDRAAVLHDYLYQNTALNTPVAWIDRTVMTREDADNAFRMAMVACQVPEATANVLFWGVRLGGWQAWNSYRKKDESNGR